MLRLTLNADILTVEALLDSADDRTRNLARKVFTRIARYRGVPVVRCERSSVARIESFTMSLKRLAR